MLYDRPAVMFWLNQPGGWQAGAIENTAITSGKSIVAADIDNDGDEDLLVDDSFTGLRLLRNDNTRSVESLVVIPRDASGAPSGDAVVELEWESGASTRREVRTGDLYGASSPPSAHFFLPESRGAASTITVRWPTGEVQRVAVTDDRVVDVVRDSD